jgi:hypothetical protein
LASDFIAGNLAEAEVCIPLQISIAIIKNGVSTFQKIDKEKIVAVFPATGVLHGPDLGTFITAAGELRCIKGTVLVMKLEFAPILGDTGK